MKQLAADFRSRVSKQLLGTCAEGGGRGDDGAAGQKRYNSGIDDGGGAAPATDDDGDDDDDDGDEISFEPDPRARPDTVSVANVRIFRVKKTMSVQSRKQIKRYTLNANKRVFLPDLTSIPYGYRQSVTDDGL